MGEYAHSLTETCHTVEAFSVGGPLTSFLVAAAVHALFSQHILVTASR
jgi:hypothetical protein